MNPLIAVVALVIVTILLASGTAKKPSPQKTIHTETVSSKSPTVTDTQKHSPNPSQSQPSQMNMALSPTNILPNSNSSQVLPGWQYPGSSGENGLFTSSDNPTDIATWYKNKIQENSMSTTSYISNTINGNISIQLVGENKNGQVSISISRPNSDTQTKITLSFNTYH